MTIPIKIYGGADTVMEKVKELRAANLVQGVDFDFAFVPGFTMNTHSDECRKHTVFTFYTEKYATFYALKWI